MFGASRAEQQNTFEFLVAVDEAVTPDKVGRLFDGYAAGLGFSNAACLKVPEPGEELIDCLWYNSRPEAWTKHYLQSNYVNYDPIVLELFRGYQPFAWSDVFQRKRLSSIGKLIVNEAAEFGMNSGFVIPIYEAGGYTGLLSVAGKDVRLSAENRRALTMAAVHAHSRFSTFKRMELEYTIALTEREKECLNWVAAGKSDWEIGQILHISAKTANYHIENSKRKFGVATRVQAVAAALRTGKLSGVSKSARSVLELKTAGAMPPTA